MNNMYSQDRELGTILARVYTIIQYTIIILGSITVEAIFAHENRTAVVIYYQKANNEV